MALSHIEEIVGAATLDALSDSIKALTAERDRYKTALEKIANAPNAEGNHTPDCELRQFVEFDDPGEDVCCSCGYWSVEYPQLKIGAIKALEAK